MTDSSNLTETRQFWDRVAVDWDLQVGEDGDTNRIVNSDPIVWDFVGQVEGLSVLDAGCGSGYLSRKLHQLGARVIGIDFSERMCQIARAKSPGLDFRVDSCSHLASVADASIDVVISNYVLMDTPDLDGTMRAFHRVLKPGGVAVLVFSHPCFPQGRALVSADQRQVDYRWDFPYFEQRKCVDPPWNHFTTEFIWFHRPLSEYWRAFKTAGFEVVDFAEPRMSQERCQLPEQQAKLDANWSRPCSVAFKLRKPAGGVE